MEADTNVVAVGGLAVVGAITVVVLFSCCVCWLLDRLFPPAEKWTDTDWHDED